MAQRGSTLSATLTAAGVGAVNGSALSLDADGGVNVGVLVNCTAITGTTPTLDVKLQWSNDSVNWVDAETPDAFTQITTVKGAAKVFAVKASLVRAVATVGGTTPAVTATVSLYPTR